MGLLGDVEAFAWPFSWVRPRPAEESGSESPETDEWQEVAESGEGAASSRCEAWGVMTDCKSDVVPSFLKLSQDL